MSTIEQCLHRDTRWNGRYFACTKCGADTSTALRAGSSESPASDDLRATLEEVKRQRDNLATALLGMWQIGGAEERRDAEAALRKAGRL